MLFDLVYLDMNQLNNFYIHFRNYFGVSPSSLRNFETMTELENAYL